MTLCLNIISHDVTSSRVRFHDVKMISRFAADTTIAVLVTYDVTSVDVTRAVLIILGIREVVFFEADCNNRVDGKSVCEFL